MKLCFFMTASSLKLLLRSSSVHLMENRRAFPEKSSYACGHLEFVPQAINEGDVDGCAASVLALALSRIGNVALVGKRHPHLLLDRKGAISIENLQGTGLLS